MRRILSALALASIASIALAASPNVLVNTDHVSGLVPTDIGLLGGTVGAGGVYVDQNCRSTYSQTLSDPTGAPYDANGCLAYNASLGIDDQIFASPLTMVTLATSAAGPVWAVNSTTAGGTTNHEPYGVIEQSSTGYFLYDDQGLYSSLIGNNILYAYAFCGTYYANDYPPVTFSTILPNNLPASSGIGCGYGTGIEFSMTPSYEGMLTNSPSATTAGLAAIYAQILENHSTWNWQDVKAALRQTASNWSSGYQTCTLNGAASCSAGTTNGYGYGNVNYTAANAFANTTAAAQALYLQPPGFTAQASGTSTTLTLYPFQQTRRVGEVIYAFTSNPASALAALITNNTLTYAQVTALGGTLAYQSVGSPTTPQTVVYFPTSSGTYYFVAFTVDNSTLASANFSRGETFSTQPAAGAAMTVSYSCLRQ